MSQVEDVLVKLFGRPSRPAYSAAGATVGTTASQIVKQNPNRLYLAIINLSAADIYVAPFEQVSTSYGFLLPPSGGSIIMNINDDLVLPSLQWSAISTVAASGIFIVEQLGITPSTETEA